MAIPEYYQLPFEEAIDYLADRLNVDTDTWLDGVGIQDVAFTVAAAKGQLLQDIRDALDVSIANGESVQTFTDKFNAIASRYADGWESSNNKAWRASLIYQQNIRQAYAAGRYKQLTEPTTLKLRPYWMWKHGGTQDPRISHLAMDGRVFPADSMSFFPPIGFNCACQIFSLSERDVKRRGLKVERIKKGQELELDDGTKISFEPDKGFDRIPKKNSAEERKEILERFNPDLRKLI